MPCVKEVVVENYGDGDEGKIVTDICNRCGDRVEFQVKPNSNL